MREFNIQAFLIKWAFVLVIITMGAVGYYKFFSDEAVGNYIYMIVALFVVIEFAVLHMTAKTFENPVPQTWGVKIMLLVALTVMWIISTVGIDQTIWGMIEAKYHKSQSSLMRKDVSQRSIADYEAKIGKLEDSVRSIREEIKGISKKRESSIHSYQMEAEKLKQVIYNNGRNCNYTDCLDRKHAVEESMRLQKSYAKEQNLLLQGATARLSAENKRLMEYRKKLTKAQEAIEEYDLKYGNEEKNRKTESLTHNYIMKFFLALGVPVESPERAYVLFLSLLVYPMYIFFVIFVSSNTPERIAQRSRRGKIFTKAE